ncbi:MAG: HDOD domain-containing protein [Desulfobacula sp.]|uniref:HDOD domain-containing protein n=1 Tax=Desulfobacula sp. TaxID=2593537 RepID=UPI0025C2256D|nr:HDOD domain-containing protein [Desulfobacula sp.]MCD4718894.1 HDOD domain-containing protein [Desulfobacula sp.]
MTDSATPHAGIELDLIDLSRVNKHSVFSGHSNLGRDIINYKTFVKEILKKILDEDSFLSFSSQIRDVNEILQMKYSSANDIANVILKDVALTSKLLKLVNSSFYGQFSHKGIATISEAMIILGTEEIKLAAASLKIYELMQDIANIKILKNKTLKALQRSIIARQIAIDEGIKDAEAIQISAMLYDFGEYLVALFSPEVFINIEIYVDENSLTREQASKHIIGISYSELGRYVISKWNLPSSIISAMKPVIEFNVVKTGLTMDDLQRYICAFSNELCGIEFSMTGESIGQKIVAVSENYKNSLEIGASKSVELLKMSWNKILKHTLILKVDVPKK